MIRFVSLLAACGIGVFLGFLWGSPAANSRNPAVAVGWCFVSQNLDLFNNRPFLSTATIVVDIHGEYIVSSQCPQSASPFNSALKSGTERDMLDDELDSGLGNSVYVAVPITFVGVAHVPSRIEYAYDSLRYWFGDKHAYGRQVTIVRLISVGKASHARL